jgi:hypothetical protein
MYGSPPCPSDCAGLKRLTRIAFSFGTTGIVKEIPAHRYVEQQYLPFITDLIPCPGDDAEDDAKGLGAPISIAP